LDRYISFGDNVVLQAIVYSLLLLFVHPRPEPRTKSLVETVCMKLSNNYVLTNRELRLYRKIQTETLPYWQSNSEVNMEGLRLEIKFP